MRFFHRQGLSLRRSCTILRISRSSLAYQPRKNDSELVKELKELAGRNSSHGARMLHGALRLRGHKVNLKRIRRLCRLYGLTRKVCPKRKRRGMGAVMPCRAEYRNHVWSCGFVHDFCENGRKLRFLTVFEEYSRICLAVEVNTRFSHIQVIEVMRNLFLMFGPPKYLRTDNGSEFIAKTLSCWLKEQEVSSRFIEPGSPWQNGRNERFNGTLRDEFLNQEMFHHVDHARAMVRLYVRKYNPERPHSRLEYRPPLDFAMSQGMVIPDNWSGCSQTIRAGNSSQRTQGAVATGLPVNMDNLEKVSGSFSRQTEAGIKLLGGTQYGGIDISQPKMFHSDLESHLKIQ